MADRPTGVTILAVLEFLGGIGMLIGGAALLATGGIMAAMMGPLGAIIGILGAVFIVLGIVAFVIGWGLWTLKPWARMVAIIFAIIGIIMALVQIATGNTGSVLSIIINGIILWYLSKPEIKAVFVGSPNSGVIKPLS